MLQAMDKSRAAPTSTRARHPKPKALNWKLDYGRAALFPRIAEQDIAASAMHPPSTKLKFID